MYTPSSYHKDQGGWHAEAGETSFSPGFTFLICAGKIGGLLSTVLSSFFVRDVLSWLRSRVLPGPQAAYDK